jgi:hypothetical protein
VLIILLKQFFTETALLGCKVQQFTVVESATEIVGQHFGYNPSATAQLASHVYYNLLVFHNIKHSYIFF